MERLRQFDEDVVLEKVLAVFWAQGWQAPSMAALAQAADVQRGSLYHAYGSKEHLFQLAFDRYAARVLAESRQALDLRRSLAVPPEAAAQTIIVFTRGLAVMERMDHEPQRLRALAAHVTTLLLRPVPPDRRDRVAKVR